MSSEAKIDPRFWRRGAVGATVATSGSAGDGIALQGDGAAWRALRRGLATRGLALLSIGRRVFIAPQEAAPKVAPLRDLAANWKDPAARAALKDLVEELFGPVRGLARTFAEAVTAARGEHRAVPGGRLEVPAPLPGCRLDALPPPRPSATKLGQLRQRAAKLSRLQRSLLLFARDYAVSWSGAPLELLPPRTRAGAAALSRALRRLEARDLLDVRRSAAGRATHVFLTPDGRAVVERS